MLANEKDILAFWDQAFRDAEPFAAKPSDFADESDVLFKEVFALGKTAHRILDVGCGAGECLIALSLVNEGKNDLLGLDGAPSAIALAEKSAALSKAKGIVFRKGSLSELQQMRSGSFDGVISSNFLDVVPLPLGEACLKEISRLLKPQGRFVLKINFYSDPSMLKTPRFSADSNGLYIDGMFRSNNQATDVWLALLKKDFTLLRQEEYPRLGKDALKDRLFVLEKK
jgi:ubiquinone/menaquinone biosynthesis C-methylase UbiE